MKSVYIKSYRTSYYPEYCIDTMTVGELIDFLSGFDENALVYIDNDNRYTFGEVNEDTIYEK